MSDARSPLRRVRMTRVAADRNTPAEDMAAAEEPLEIRLHGKPFAVIMRTPGEDRELAAGFLLAEGIVAGHADLGALEQCHHPHHPDVHNIVDVYLLGPAAAGLGRHLEERRNVLTTSACGLCGRVTIDSLRQHRDRLAGGATLTRTVVAALPARLREQQAVFERTGGLHAAALFTEDGTCIAAAEDVGRHNAVDKVIGAMLLSDRLPLTACALAVSGRASFEILQKAWVAGVPIVCAISAPSSLAIDLAHEAGITLIGFARDAAFNLYTHPERISGVGSALPTAPSR